MKTDKSTQDVKNTDNEAQLYRLQVT